MSDFTQEQVNAMVGQARQEARDKATDAAAERFGKELAAAKAEAEKHSKTLEDYTGKLSKYETDKAEWAKERETLAAQAARAAELEQGIKQRDFEDLLTTKGVKPEFKTEVRILLEAQNKLVDADGKPKPIDKVLEEVRPRYTGFFVEQAADNTAPAGTSKTKGGPPKNELPDPFAHLRR